MSTTNSTFSGDDVRRITAETFVARVEHHATLPSTNDRALQMSQDPQQVESLPMLVLVDRQTAGRGRGANRWWSSHGALTFSVVIDMTELGATPAIRPRISLAAGLAVCDAVETLLQRNDLRLKWPNDVLVGNRKLCGILAEISPHRQNLLVLGIGLNVNNLPADAPADLQPIVTSLRELSGQTISLCDAVVVILNQLSFRLRWIVRRSQELQRHWQQRCTLTNRQVRLELFDRCTWGMCRGIDHDGALLLDTSAGLQRHLSGVVKQ